MLNMLLSFAALYHLEWPWIALFDFCTHFCGFVSHFFALKDSTSFDIDEIENLKHIKLLDPLGQVWQNGSALAAQTHGRAAVNKYRLCGSLLYCVLSHANITHSNKAKLMSFWNFGMYISVKSQENFCSYHQLTINHQNRTLQNLWSTLCYVVYRRIIKATLVSMVVGMVESWAKNDPMEQ